MRNNNFKTTTNPIPSLGRSEIKINILKNLKEFFISFDAKTCEKKLRTMSSYWLLPDSHQRDQDNESSKSDITFYFKVRTLLRFFSEQIENSKPEFDYQIILKELFSKYDIDSIEYTLEETLQASLTPELYNESSKTIEATNHFQNLISSLIKTLHDLEALLNKKKTTKNKKTNLKLSNLKFERTMEIEERSHLIFLLIGKSMTNYSNIENAEISIQDGSRIYCDNNNLLSDLIKIPLSELITSYHVIIDSDNTAVIARINKIESNYCDFEFLNSNKKAFPNSRLKLTEINAIYKVVRISTTWPIKN